MKLFYVILISFLINACGSNGYEPVPKLAKSIFQEPVLVKVSLNEKDPQSGKYIEDELIKTLTNRLNLKITSNATIAKNYIIVTIYAINASVANKDNDGNPIRYSINAALKFAVEDRYGFWFKNIVTNEFVSVKAKSILSENEREKAEKIAIQKALDNFILAIATRAKDVKNKKIDSTLNKNNNESFNSDYKDENEKNYIEENSSSNSNSKIQNFYLIDEENPDNQLVEIKL